MFRIILDKAYYFAENKISAHNRKKTDFKL